jgi:hypothetical protein
MADNEKLNIDIQSKFDISNVEKNIKKIQNDMSAMAENARKALAKPRDEMGRFIKSTEELGKKAVPIFDRIEKNINAVNAALKKATSEGHIAKLNAELKKLNLEQERLNKLGVDSGNNTPKQIGMIGQLKNSYMLLGVAIAGVTGTAYKMFDLLKKGTEFNELRSAFKGTEEDIKNFQKATAGTVTKGDLIKMSNQMSDLGINLRQQTILFALAEDQADAYGTSVQEGMSKVLQASNGSERALAKLGISVVTYKNNLDELVKASGKKIEMMTIEEQETIKLEALMRSTNMTYDEATSKIASQADQIEQLGVAYGELEIQVGQFIAKNLEQSGIISNLNYVMKDLNTTSDIQNESYKKTGRTLFDVLIPGYQQLNFALRTYIRASGGGLKLEMSVQEAYVKAKDMKLAAEEAAAAATLAKKSAGTTKGKPLSDQKDLSSYYKEGTKGYVVPRAGLPTGVIADYKEPGMNAADLKTPYELYRQEQENIDRDEDQKRLDRKKKDEDAEKQKWDTIQSIAQQGTDIIGDQLYNAFTGQNVSIERAFKQLLARMAADFIASGILSLLMKAINPASEGTGLFGMLFAATGAENIQGAGSETSDSIPARLSKGESVLTAGATKAVQQSMGEGWITNLNKQYARSRSNMAMGTFAGGIESMPSRQSQVVVSREIGDLYIDSQQVDYAIRTRGKIKNDRRMS